VLVLDDRRLRNLPQLVEGGVGQVEPAVEDRQPAVGIVDDRDALAAELAGELVWLDQEHDLVVLQGQVIGDRALFAPGEDVGEIVVRRRKQVDADQRRNNSAPPCAAFAPSLPV
jgi:hypothetical protein